MNTRIRPTLRCAGRTVLALSLVLIMSAFRHTDVETRTNPAYADYKFDTVLVQLPTGNHFYKEIVLERLAKQFRKSDVKIYTSDDLFSPFKQWTAAEKSVVLAARGVDATIVISLEEASQRESSGMIFFDADLGMASHVQSRSDRLVFHIRLIDIESADLVWTGILKSRGSGTLFTGDKSVAKAVSKHVAKALRESGHL